MTKITETVRLRNAEAARHKFERVTAEMAAEHRFGGHDQRMSEIEILEEATELVKQATGER